MKKLPIKVWMTFGILAVSLAAVIPAGRMPLAQEAPGSIPGASTGHPQQSSSPLPGLGEPASEMDESRARMAQQREKAQIDDRQKHLQADTARLVQLSNELKDEVDKSGKFVTSVTAMRKAEEIEKLAHSVRDRMKN